MRVKSDTKRKAIMAAAAEIFKMGGYERASMSKIAAHVGGSKATLYSYFPSKEELSSSIMLEDITDQREHLLGIVASPSADLRVTLLKFCKEYIAFILNDDVLANIRIAIAEGAKSDLGRMIYERGPKEGFVRVASFISEAIKIKKIRQVDPFIAAMQLKGLMEAGLLEPSLHGAEPLFSKDAVAEAAVDTFLRAYEIT